MQAWWAGYRELDTGGDGRQACIVFFFPMHVPEQLVVDWYLRDHGETRRTGDIHLNCAEGRSSLQKLCFSLMSNGDGG